MLSAGDAQTFNTPSNGASHDNNRPSGDSFTLKNVGLSNSLRRGIRGTLTFGFIRVSRAIEEWRVCRRSLSERFGMTKWKRSETGKVYQRAIKGSKLHIFHKSHFPDVRVPRVSGIRYSALVCQRLRRRRTPSSDLMIGHPRRARNFLLNS
jgi:hypothetical protein